MMNRALEYLLRKPILNICMTEPLRLGFAYILCFSPNGVMLRETKSGILMLSCDNEESCLSMLDKVESCHICAVTGKSVADAVMMKFSFSHSLECYSVVYEKPEPLPIPPGFSFRVADESTLPKIIATYDKADENELRETVAREELFCAFRGNDFIGYVGWHPEGSIGLLDVFPEHRRLGYGSTLESYIVNKSLERGLVPYGQVITDNSASLALQRKLGLSISHETMFWCY